MPNLRLDDGTNLFDHMRGIHATEVVTQENVRILVRPDGYISSIGTRPTETYAGEFTRRVEWLREAKANPRND